jgi:hypothetical protein
MQSVLARAQVQEQMQMQVQVQEHVHVHWAKTTECAWPSAWPGRAYPTARCLASAAVLAPRLYRFRLARDPS